MNRVDDWDLWQEFHQICHDIMAGTSNRLPYISTPGLEFLSRVLCYGHKWLMEPFHGLIHDQKYILEWTEGV